MPFYPFLGEGSPTRIHYRKRGTLILSSLLENLGKLRQVVVGWPEGVNQLFLTPLTFGPIGVLAGEDMVGHQQISGRPNLSIFLWGKHLSLEEVHVVSAEGMLTPLINDHPTYYYEGVLSVGNLFFRKDSTINNWGGIFHVIKNILYTSLLVFSISLLDICSHVFRGRKRKWKLLIRGKHCDASWARQAAFAQEITDDDRAALLSACEAGLWNLAAAFRRASSSLSALVSHGSLGMWQNKATPEVA